LRGGGDSPSITAARIFVCEMMDWYRAYRRRVREFEAIIRAEFAQYVCGDFIVAPNGLAVSINTYCRNFARAEAGYQMLRSS